MKFPGLVVERVCEFCGYCHWARGWMLTGPCRDCGVPIEGNVVWGVPPVLIEKPAEKRSKQKT